MSKLTFYQTLEVDELASPEGIKHFSLNSPALEFLTDFSVTKPLVITHATTAIEAKKLMKVTHVRLKFVVDDNNRFIGVVSADDLIERRLVQKISEGFKRDEVSVVEFMTPKRKLLAFDIEEVAKSTIGDVVSALKDSGNQHCLVIDEHDHKIRGIFSASDISRKLHLPINIHEKSSFYKVFAAVS